MMSLHVLSQSVDGCGLFAVVDGFRFFNKFVRAGCDV
jgi:hypothetical protein